MKYSLPHYVETGPGEVPDGYYIEGARVVSISLIAESVEMPLPSQADPWAEARRAAAVANSALVARIEQIERVAATVDNRLPRPASLKATDLEMAPLREAQARSAALRAAWATGG